MNFLTNGFKTKKYIQIPLKIFSGYATAHIPNNRISLGKFPAHVVVLNQSAVPFQRKCSQNKIMDNTHTQANGVKSMESFVGFFALLLFWQTYIACRHSGPNDSFAGCVPCDVAGRSWRRLRAGAVGGGARLGCQSESKEFSIVILNFRQTVCGLCIFGFSVAFLIPFSPFPLLFLFAVAYRSPSLSLAQCNGSFPRFSSNEKVNKRWGFLLLAYCGFG